VCGLCPRPERALAQAKLRGIVPTQLSVDEFTDVAIRYGAAYRDNVNLARSYQPSRPIPRALVVEAADQPDGDAAPGAQRSAWSDWVDQLDREEVAGDHFSILRPPHVRRLVAVLTTHLTARSAAWLSVERGRR
jgi:thioesterase domain-containing protein